MNDAVYSGPKELCSNDSVSVQYKCPRIGRAALYFVFGFGVEYTEFLDGFAIRIGQKRKHDLLFFGEFGQGRYGIITDGDHLNARGLDLGQAGLQFDQLLLAVRSPPDRTMKNDCDLAFLEELVKAPLDSLLVMKLESRRMLPNGHTGWSGRSGLCVATHDHD